ncbi:MAG: hypothetical protein IJ125_00560 [Atopobiaceae bacterium]|nr:hypothetical protein [Atopobiaceae bacterium]
MGAHQVKTHNCLSNKAWRMLVFASMLLFCIAFAGTPRAFAQDSAESQLMYRLYNPNSGEHFYTASSAEKNSVVAAGWIYEGIGWIAPQTSAVPVYRLYNPNAGDHHYTMNSHERDHLVSVGWRYEGISWYSSDSKAVQILRQYNPNATSGAHNYSSSVPENEMLVLLGWKPEGVAWYGRNLNVRTASDRPTLYAHRAMSFIKEYCATGMLLDQKNELTLIKRPGWSLTSLNYVMPESALWKTIRSASDNKTLSIVKNCELVRVDDKNVTVTVTTASTSGAQLGWTSKTQKCSFVLTFNDLGLIVSCQAA